MFISYLVISHLYIPINLLIKSKLYLENAELIKWIIYQIAFGLYTIHSNNIIHHDIKPSNILIDSKSRISICDFGSALIKDEDTYEYSLSYASPEFLIKSLKKANDKIDQKYDMWSLGIVILELILEDSAFHNKNNKDKKVQLKKNFILGIDK